MVLDAERGRAEATVREERDRAQQYLDIANVILLALDLDGRITLINRKGCSMLGWKENELLGRDWINACLPPEIRTKLSSISQSPERRLFVYRKSRTD
jgi:PAS domain S-box-containing protein